MFNEPFYFLDLFQKIKHHMNYKLEKIGFNEKYLILKINQNYSIFNVHYYLI